MLHKQTTPNRSQGARNALTFGIVSVAVFLLPVFFPPSGGDTPRPAPAAVASASPFTGPLLSATPVASHFQESPESDWNGDPTTEIAGHLRRVFLSLLATVGVILLTFKLFGKRLPGLMGQRRASWMTLLGREALGPTQSVALMRVGSRVLLVGISENSMNTLGEFSPEEADAMLAPPPRPEGEEEAPPPTPREIYGNILRQYLAILPGMGGSKK